jgi:hypothetical protein
MDFLAEASNEIQETQYFCQFLNAFVATFYIEDAAAVWLYIDGASALLTRLHPSPAV